MEFEKRTKTVRIHSNDKPFRVQIPRMRVSDFTEYGYLEMECVQEFIDLWNSFEKDAKENCPYSSPWRSNVEDGKFRVKIDERTHIFDSKSELIWTDKFVGKNVTCIIELKSIYDFKGNSGVSCRVHQLKIWPGECLL